MGAQEEKRTCIGSEPQHGHWVHVTALPCTAHRVCTAQSLCIEQAPGLPDTSAAHLCSLRLEDPEQKRLPKAFPSPTYVDIKTQTHTNQVVQFGPHTPGWNIYSSISNEKEMHLGSILLSQLGTPLFPQGTLDPQGRHRGNLTPSPYPQSC